MTIHNKVEISQNKIQLRINSEYKYYKILRMTDSGPPVHMLLHVLKCLTCLRHHDIYNVPSLRAIQKESPVNTRLPNLHDMETYKQHNDTIYRIMLLL